VTSCTHGGDGNELILKNDYMEVANLEDILEDLLLQLLGQNT
jgi:hypothetical protein